jgi:transposase-like protein
MAERGVMVAHSTILRWVSRYVPEYEKRWNRFSRPVGTSWRWRRDVRFHSEANGTISIERSTSRERRSTFSCAVTAASRRAQAFFRKALATNLNRWPRKATLDGHVPSHRALRLLRREDPKWRNVELRTRKYLAMLLSRTIARSNGDVPPWPALSRSAMRPLPLPESSWRIAFINGNSHLASVDRVASGR